ncbi:MAG: FAD-dependent monooxygenase [Bacteroidales bacterium]|jgi:geranylgeranyl reductase family protein|nr:FAD-dependent monooxygenase [Bacteroidales bacterium]
MVIILGAGPSGVACGYKLQRAGVECLLIDKMNFPREKICGGGLTPKAYELIDKLFDGLQYEYRSIGKIEIRTVRKFITAFSLKKEIRTVVRNVFDETLLSAYRQAGGKFLVARVAKIEETGEKICLVLHDGTTLLCNTLVGADGANSFVRKYLQPDTPKGMLAMEKKNSDKSVPDIQVFFDRSYTWGYGYVFPNPQGSVVGYSFEGLNISRFNNEIHKTGLNDAGKLKGAYIPMFDKLDYPFRKNILLTGDAGGYVDSISGEGLYYALKTGENAATAILEDISFQLVNKGIIQRIQKLIRYSRIFYHPAFQKLFLFICSQKWLKKKLEKIADYYIAR